MEYRFSYFQNHEAYHSKVIDLQELVRLIRYDDYVRNVTEQYRQRAYTVGRQSANNDVKKAVMPVFSVAVLYNGEGKQTSHITEFTGLVFCDIDHVDDVDEAFRKVKADPHTFLVYRTISGEGLRVLFSYRRESGDPHLNADSYAPAFLHGNRYYAELTGTAYDSQCGNVNRNSTLAHDPDVYVNTEAVPFIVTEQEILEESFRADKEAGKPRKEDATGTNTATVEEAWQVVEPMMNRRKLVFAPTRHHHYVLHAAYVFNRLGVPLDDLLTWAAQQWGAYERKGREDCIRWVYRKGESLHGTWRTKGSRKKSLMELISIDEMCQWLRHRHIAFRYNILTDQTFYRTGDKEEWQQVDNRVICSLRSAIAKDTGKRVQKSDVTDVIQSDFAQLVHPVRDYIDNLAPWDGTDRVEQLAEYLTAEPTQEGQTFRQAQEELLWALHKWLVAMVAAWKSDDMSNHSIFVLIGRQGIFKTTFFRFLLPPPLRAYFWENSHNSFASKDDHLALAENCLVEIEEIDMSKEKDISELKALATAITVKERRPYARFREAKHRLASFCASGNQQRFLSDETGNRRWLCFKVSHIDDPRQWQLDYSQLYAQLRDEFQHGFQHWFDLNDQQRVERQNEAFRIESDEEQLIRSRLRIPRKGDSVKKMTATEICMLLNNGHLGGGISSRKMCNTLLKLGYEFKHTRDGNYFCIYEVPWKEQQSYITSKIMEESDKQPVTKEEDLPF